MYSNSVNPDSLENSVKTCLVFNHTVTCFSSESRSLVCCAHLFELEYVSDVSQT